MAGFPPFQLADGTYTNIPQPDKQMAGAAPVFQNPYAGSLAPTVYSQANADKSQMSPYQQALLNHDPQALQMLYYGTGSKPINAPKTTTSAPPAPKGNSHVGYATTPDEFYAMYPESKARDDQQRKELENQQQFGSNTNPTVLTDDERDRWNNGTGWSNQMGSYAPALGSKKAPPPPGFGGTGPQVSGTGFGTPGSFATPGAGWSSGPASWANPGAGFGNPASWAPAPGANATSHLTGQPITIQNNGRAYTFIYDQNGVPHSVGPSQPGV